MDINLSRYPAKTSPKIIVKETTVKSTIDEVWERWTTSSGTQKFFSSKTNVELRPGGPYEIHFLLDAPAGEQGSEGCRVLSFIPRRMLSFEWNAPPSFGELRGQHTQVIILFEQTPDDEIKITLYHHGFGISKKWDEIYEYFDKAWVLVLEWFQKSFKKQKK